MAFATSNIDSSAQALLAAANYQVGTPTDQSLNSFLTNTFSDFLPQMPKTPPAQSPVAATPAPQTNANANAQASAQTPSFPALKKLAFVLHIAVRTLQAHEKVASNDKGQSSADAQGNNAANPSGTQTQAAAAAAQAAAATTPAVPAQTPTSTATTAQDATTSPDASVTGTTLLDPATLLAQLQSLLKDVEKQLQAASTSNAATTSATQASATSDATNAAAATATANANALTAPSLDQILKNILAFLQASPTGQMTGSTQTTSTTSTSTADTSAPTTLSPQEQVKADMNALADALKSYMDNALTTSDPKATNAAQATNDAGASANTPAPTLSADKAASNPTTAETDNFFNLFSNQPSNNANFVSMAAVTSAATGGKSDTSLDLDMGSQGQGSSASAQSALTNTTNANSVMTTAENTKVDPYSFASQLTATRATSLGATGLPNAVEQVILQLNRNVKTGNDQMTLQLNPADLGRVNIKLDIAADGKVQGTVTADNPVTLHLLSKDVGSLERALQEAGLRADSGSLQFNLSGQTGNPAGQNGNPSGTSGNANSDTAANTTSLDIDASGDQAETWYVTPGRVNLKV